VSFRIGTLLTATVTLLSFIVIPLAVLEYIPSEMTSSLFIGARSVRSSIYELAVFGVVYSGLFFVRSFVKKDTSVDKAFKILPASFWLVLLLYQFASSGSFGEFKIISLAGGVENSITINYSILISFMVFSIFLSIAYTLFKEFYIEIKEEENTGLHMP
jgi:hypothetical protein